MTAEQYEQQNKGMVAVSDDTVRMLADGITAIGQDRNGRQRTRVMPGVGIAPWLQRTMGLRIREALGVRKADFKQRADGTRYLFASEALDASPRELANISQILGHDSIETTLRFYTPAPTPNSGSAR